MSVFLRVASCELTREKSSEEKETHRQVFFITEDKIEQQEEKKHKNKFAVLHPPRHPLPVSRIRIGIGVYRMYPRTNALPSIHYFAYDAGVFFLLAEDFVAFLFGSFFC